MNKCEQAQININEMINEISKEYRRELDKKF